MARPADRPHRTNSTDGRPMVEQLRGYIAAIPAEHRPLFDRLHQLIIDAHPGVTVTMSYRMPTYQVDDCRVHLGVWKHGISIYGWRRENDGGFLTRHPALRTSTGTIRLRPDDADEIGDDELLGLLRPALKTGAS